MTELIEPTLGKLKLKILIPLFRKTKGHFQIWEDKTRRIQKIAIETTY